MLDAIALDGTDLPTDVIDLLTKITEVQGSEHSLTFTGKELGTLGQAVGGFKRALTHSLRSIPTEAVGSVVELLTEATAIEKRIESVVHCAFTDALGPGYEKSDAAQKLDSLIAARAERPQPQEKAGASSAPDDAAYL